MASCNGFMITADPILGNIAINQYIETSLLPGELRPEKLQFGVLVTGGKDASFNHLSSAEFLGPKKCHIPPLPQASFTELRYFACYSISFNEERKNYSYSFYSLVQFANKKEPI